MATHLGAALLSSLYILASEASHKSWNYASIDRGAENHVRYVCCGQWFVYYSLNWAGPSI